MIDVEVRNFQSIRSAKFNIEGFTALVGRSNIGKSAVVRALRSALTGASGTDFVRHEESCERLRGSKKCKCSTSVRIKTESFEVLWKKGDNVNQYEVTKDGKTSVYDKVGQGSPDFLYPEFEPVKVGSDQEVIQIAEQFAPIFLLDQSGNVVADVLSDVAKLDDINAAIGLVAKDRKSAVATRKVREKDIVSIQGSLDSFNGLDAVLGKVALMESKAGRIQDIEKLRDLLDGWVTKALRLVTFSKKVQLVFEVDLPEEDLQNLYYLAKKLSGWFQVLSSKALVYRNLKWVDSVHMPDTSDIKRICREACTLHDWSNKIDSYLNTCSGLEKVFEAVYLVDIQTLQSKVLELANLHDWLNKLVEYQIACSKLEEVFEVNLADVRPLREKLSEVIAFSNWSGKLSLYKGRLLKLSESLKASCSDQSVRISETLDNVSDLSDFISKQNRLQIRQAALESSLDVVEQDLANNLESIKTLGLCPTCYQDLGECLHL